MNIRFPTRLITPGFSYMTAIGMGSLHNGLPPRKPTCNIRFLAAVFALIEIIDRRLATLAIRKVGADSSGTANELNRRLDAAGGCKGGGRDK